MKIAKIYLITVICATVFWSGLFSLYYKADEETTEQTTTETTTVVTK